MKRSTTDKRGQRVILYTRVSTDEQATKGYSLRDQEARLRQYCRIAGHTVVQHFQDEGASAKTFDRPAFQALLRYVSEHKQEVDLVLFVKWDRFSRNIEAAYAMIRRLSDWGVQVQAVEQPVDVDVPEQKLMLAFYLAAPQVENERRALNTKRGMRRAMREGRFISRAPKGYRHVKDETGKSILKPNKDASFVKQAFAEMAKGVYTMEEVRLRLRKQGFYCSKNQFCLLLSNRVYTGKIVIPAWKDEEEEVVEGLHEALISEAIFERVQDLLRDRRGRRYNKPTRRHEALPLRGYLKCKQCGGHLTGSATKGNGGTYYYYHCQKGCKERFRADEANQQFVKRLGTLTIAPEVARLYMAVMKDIFVEKEGDREQQLKNVEVEIEKLEKRLFDVDEKFIEGAIERDSYHRLKSKYQEEKGLLERRRTDLQQMDTNYMRYVRYGLSLLAQLPRYYKEASIEVKQKMIGLIFPGKLIYDGEKYRTKKLNEAIALLAGKKGDFGAKKEGPTANLCCQSYKVALPGFEPGTS